MFTEEDIERTKDDIKRDMRYKAGEWLKYMQRNMGKIDECHEEIICFNPLGERYRVVFDITKE